jgi:hypothetical protein
MWQILWTRHCNGSTRRLVKAHSRSVAVSPSFVTQDRRKSSSRVTSACGSVGRWQNPQFSLVGAAKEKGSMLSRSEAGFSFFT